MNDALGVGPKTKRSNLLMASLALNLLVVGLVGGAVAARQRGGPAGELNIGRMLGEPGLRGFVHSLPKDRSALLRAAGDEFRQSLKPLRQAAMRSRSEAAAALRSEPLDVVAIENALQNWSAAETEVRRGHVALLVTTVKQMTPEERSQFQAWRKKHEAGFLSHTDGKGADGKRAQAVQPSPQPTQPR